MVQTLVSGEYCPKYSAPPVVVGFPSLVTSGACVAKLIDVFIELLSRKYGLDFGYGPG